MSVAEKQQMDDEFVLEGHCLVEVFDEDGNLKDFREVTNKIVDAGRNAILDRIVGSPGTAVPIGMALGTGVTAPVAGDTALQTEIDRNAISTNTRSGGVNTMVCSWAAGDATNGAITEAGVLSTSTTGGTLFSRATFTAIPKGASDTLQITWTYTLTPS